MRACVRACVPEKLKPPRTSRAWAVLGVVRATCCSPHHCTLPPTTTTTTTPAVRGVCRNELKQTLVNQKKKKETHTPSATCQRRFLNKKPTIVFCSRCRSPLSAVTISATTGLGKVEVYAVCAQLSAGSGSGWSANTSSPTWLQQGGVRLGCRVEAVGQWQAAVAAAPPDILHNKSLDSVQFSRVNPKHRAFAMLKLSNFWSRF